MCLARYYKMSKSGVIISIDFETTGLSTVKDRIVEYGLIKQLSNGTRVKLVSLVNPGVPIPPFVQGIHHISDEMVKDAKCFGEHAPKIVEFLSPGATLCGHNLWRYDLPLLQAELVRAGFKPLDISQYNIVDSLILFRKMELHTLAKAVEFYCPDQKLAPEDAHRACNDATAALDVYIQQSKKYQAVVGHSPEQVAAFCGTAGSTNTTAHKRSLAPSTDPKK